MEEIDYFPLFIIFTIAWAVPFILSWLEFSKVPSVIVIILMGVAIGPYGLDWIPDEQYIDFLAETGFFFLLFLAGLEIDIDTIINSIPRGRLRKIDLVSNSLLLANFIYFGSLVLALIVSLLINYFFEIDIIFYTILFPTVALTIVVPILKADGELPRKFGQILLMEGGIATIMSILFIAIYSGIVKSGLEIELLYFIIIFLVFILVYFIGRNLVKFHTFQRLLYRLEHAASQIRVRGTIALIFFFVFIAQVIDTELVLGAFFAGMLLSIFLNKERSALLFKLDGMSYGFFIPIFFIMVGVDLDISALSRIKDSIIFITILSAAFLFVQIVPSMLMTGIFTVRKSIAGGVLLTARMGLTIAAAQIGLSLGIISPAANTGIVASAIIVSLITPLVYKVLNKEEKVRFDIYIIGGSKASLYLAEKLQMHGLPYIVIMSSKEYLEEFERRSLNYKIVNDLNEAELCLIDLRPSDLIVVLAGSKTLNIELSKFVHDTLDHHKVMTIVKREIIEEVRAISELEIIDTDEVLAKHIEDLILLPDAVTSVAESFKEYSIEEIQLTNSSMDRKKVKDITFPPTGSLVILRRGNEIFIPHGNTHLLLGDIVTVIGNREALVEFREILG